MKFTSLSYLVLTAISALSCYLPIISRAALSRSVCGTVTNLAQSTPSLGTLSPAPFSLGNKTWHPLSSAPIGGRMAYISSVQNSNRVTQILGLSQLLGNSTQNSSRDALRLEKVLNIPSETYDPQFSPNGKYVLYKNAVFGWPSEREGYYYPSVFDIENNKVTPLYQQDAVYPVVKWSPDSRYIAYIKGSDYFGLPVSARSGQVTPPSPKLMIYDMKTRRTLTVSGDIQLPQFEWTPQNTLLFTKVISVPGLFPDDNADAPLLTSRVQRFSVHEFDLTQPNKSQIKLLIQDAQEPLPNPNGKSVVFSRTSRMVQDAMRAEAYRKAKGLNTDTQQAQEVPKAASSFLFYRQSLVVTPLPTGWHKFTCWTPDGRQLIKVMGRSEGVLSVYDIANNSKRDFTIQKNIDVSTNANGFQYVDLSSDSRFVIIKMIEVYKSNDRIDRSEKTTFLSVSIQDGRVIPIAEFENARGADWISYPRIKSPK